MAESRWMELYVSIRLYRACIDPKPRLEPVGDRLEWMAEWINEWVCARPGEWMNCNLFWICRQSAKSWLPLPLPMPQPSPAPWAVIWFTFFFRFIFFFIYFVLPFEKSSHERDGERRRQNVDRMWGCVFFSPSKPPPLYLPASSLPNTPVSLLRLPGQTLIILLKQISTLKLITLMKLCLGLRLLLWFFALYHLLTAFFCLFGGVVRFSPLFWGHFVAAISAAFASKYPLSNLRPREWLVLHHPSIS